LKTKILFFATVLCFLFWHYFVKFDENEVKKVFWESYDADQFSLFINFDDSSKPFFFELRENKLIREGKVIAKLISYSSFISKKITIKDNSNNYYNYIEYKR
jgi:hypothetical protein